MKIPTSLFINGLLISMIAVSSVAQAETSTSITTQSKQTQAVKVKKETSSSTPAGDVATEKTTTKTPADYLKKENKEVMDAFKKVFEARNMIKKGLEREAIVALKDASKKFDAILLADPTLKLTPIVTDMQITETFGPLDVVKSQISLAQKLLKQGKVQDVRAILLPLSDEMITHTVYLPMGTYPNSIKLATEKLTNADKSGAVSILDTSFNSIVEEEAIVPLSLLRAEAMITAASELDKVKDKKEVLELLDAASEQLELAKILGYTNEASDEYLDLSMQIKALKKEATGGNVVERLYDKLKGSMSKLIHHHLDKTTPIKNNTPAKKMN